MLNPVLFLKQAKKLKLIILMCHILRVVFKYSRDRYKYVMSVVSNNLLCLKLGAMLKMSMGLD